MDIFACILTVKPKDLILVLIKYNIEGAYGNKYMAEVP